MNRVYSLLLIFVMMLSLCACGDTEETTVKSPEEKIAAAAENRISVEGVNFWDVQFNQNKLTSYVNIPKDEFGRKLDITDGTYRVTGKCGYWDEYGDSYTGTYDATVKYTAETNSAVCTDVQYGNFYKD